MKAKARDTLLVSTGNSGLDYILGGGLPASRMYLIEGDPGTGKTTVGLQFLLDGASRGERVLHITLGETSSELEDIARSHGWELSDIEVEELLPDEEFLDPDAHYTMFHPSEVELGDNLRRIFDRAKSTNPQRIVVDSLSEIRLLAGDPLRYRRQLMLLKRFFMGQRATVLLLNDRSAPAQRSHCQKVASLVSCLLKELGLFEPYLKLAAQSVFCATWLSVIGAR